MNVSSVLNNLTFQRTPFLFHSRHQLLATCHLKLLYSIAETWEGRELNTAESAARRARPDFMLNLEYLALLVEPCVLVCFKNRVLLTDAGYISVVQNNLSMSIAWNPQTHAGLKTVSFKHLNEAEANVWAAHYAAT